MARLKRDNSSWKAHGLYKKYQQPAVNETAPKQGAAKKNTNKWCRGKVGKPHDWQRFQRKRWNDERWAFMNTYMVVKCVECQKEKYLKTAKTSIYPFHAFIEYENLGYQSIQVRVNGKILPIAEYQYHSDKYWCKQCGTFHKS